MYGTARLRERMLQDTGLTCISQNKIKVEVANSLEWIVEVIGNGGDVLESG